MKRKYPKWTAERRAKFQATVAAKHKKRYFRKGGMIDLPAPEVRKVKTQSRDVLVLLRLASQSVVARLRDGSLRRPDQAHLLSMQALATLEGDA